MAASTEMRTHFHSSLRGIGLYGVHLIIPHGTHRCTYLPIMHPPCIDVMIRNRPHQFVEQAEGQNVSRECQTLSLFSSLQNSQAQSLAFCEFFLWKLWLNSNFAIFFFSDLYNSHSLLPLFKILPNVLAPHKQYLLIFLNHSGLPESRLTLKDRMP